MGSSSCTPAVSTRFRLSVFCLIQQIRTLIKMVTVVNDLDDFKKKLESAGDKLVVVDFFATWCGPCKVIGPKIDEMAKAMKNVLFLKVDVDEAEDVATEYNITAMPTFLFMKKGNKLDDLMGANHDKLTELIEKHA